MDDHLKATTNNHQRNYFFLAGCSRALELVAAVECSCPVQEVVCPPFWVGRYRVCTRGESGVLQ